MKEFFGFGGYSRPPEGYLSSEHLIFVSSLMVVMIALAVFLGVRYRGRGFREKLKPLAVAAIGMDGIELIKIVIICFRNHDALSWLYILPLFLCSIQLISPDKDSGDRADLLVCQLKARLTAQPLGE